MAVDADTSAALSHMELRLSSEIAATKEIARVAKHDQAQTAQAVYALDLRLTKLQDKTEAGFEKLGDKLADEIKALSSQISLINVQQGKSAGFYAGVAAVMTLAVTIIMALAKMLFGGAHA